MASNPQWVNVPFSSPGSESTPPAGTNFALSPGSPAIGYGAISRGILGGCWRMSKYADNVSVNEPVTT
jgi:hypothetical protein